VSLGVCGSKSGEIMTEKGQFPYVVSKKAIEFISDAEKIEEFP
jgi:hypothetical protein